MKDRKRHIVVDVLGCLLSVNVHATNVYDTKSEIAVDKQDFDKYPSSVNTGFKLIIY